MSGDGYEYDNEDDGMRAALERQRKKPSHIDEAVSLLSKDEPPAADVAHDAMAPAKPYGPVEPPPSEPPSVAPPPEAPPEQPFKANDFPVQTSAPKTDPKLAALGTLSKFIDSGTFPTIAGLGDGDLEAAQQRDRQEVRRNNFTKAISSGLLRKPYEPDAAPEAPGLLQRRQLADQGQARQLSAQEKLVAALKGEDMTPYQTQELQLRKDELGKKDQDKKDALSARKATLLQLHPDAAAQINGLTDLGDAQALEGFLNTKSLSDATRGHQDATEARREGFQAAQQGRSEDFQKQLKEWERENQNMSAEQRASYEGFGEADATIDELKKHFSDVSGVTGKIGAALPSQVSGALGMKGGNFGGVQEEAAANLARAVDGGQARPGTIKTIMRMMPHASDSDAIKEQKAENLRGFMHAKGESFMRSLRAEGVRAPASSGIKPPPGEAAAPVKMKFPDGSVHDVTPDKLEKARQKGGVEVDGG